MTRKLLSLLVAVAVVLSSFSVAFAASVPTDVTSDYVKAVSKLGSLNIMSGYPDGTFKPDQTITRAEFAKIAVVAMGLKDAATISNGTTKFSDVAADHWAAGYINVASSQGIINGYPDGTYKPEQTINYAEAITILAKMLGYGPILAGKPWPSAYVAKANEVGITSGVVLAPTVGASRGNVANLMSNTLDSKIVYVDQYDESGKPVYKVSTVTTLLADKLSVTQIVSGNYKVYKVTGTPCVQNGATVTTSTLTNVDDGTVVSRKFAAGLNPDDYLGLNVKAWYNNDGDICIAEIQNEAADVYEGLIAKDTDHAGKITLVGKSANYEAATTYVGYINSSGPAASTSLENVRTILGDNDKANARVVLKDGKISFINVIVGKTDATYSTTSQFTVKDIKDGYIRSIHGIVADMKVQDIKDNITTKTKRYDFIKGGAAVTIDDVKAGDVVTKMVNGNYEKWIITANEVKATLTGIAGSGASRVLTVGGKEYKFASTNEQTVNSGTDWTSNVTSTSSDLVGKEVTIRLNDAGQVAYLSTAASASTYYYGIFAGAAMNAATSTGSLANFVSVYKPDGTKVTYGFEKDANLSSSTPFAKAVNGATNNTVSTTAAAIISGTNLTAGDLIEYQLTADGKIKDTTVKALGSFANADMSTQTATGWSGTPAQDAASVNKINGLVVTGETVIFNVYDLVYNNDTVRIISYSTIKNKLHGYKYAASGTIAKYVAVNGGDNTGNIPSENGYWEFWSKLGDTLTSSTSGVITGYGTNTDGEYVTVTENGTAKSYNLASSVALSTLVSAYSFTANAVEGRAAEKGYYIEYSVNSAGKIASVISAAYTSTTTMAGFTRSRTATYRISSIDATNKVITVTDLDSNKMAGSKTYYFTYDSTNVQLYDCTTKGAPVGGKAITDLAQDDYIWVNVGVTSAGSVAVTRIIKVNRDDLQ